MKHLILIFVLFLAISACKQGDESSGSNIITDPALLPDGAIAIIDGIPICEAGDHSCRDGTYGTHLTKKQCEYLQDWELGDPAVFYFGLTIPTSTSFFDIGPEGVVKKDFIDPENPLEYEVRIRQGSGMQIEKNCRCQVDFENGLIVRVLVESKWGSPTQEQFDICATKEP